MRRRRRCAPRAYPRWRGGNRGCLDVGDERLGLSPLARGKLRPDERADDERGPIPAGAGETERVSVPRPCRGAYPRWRGGNVGCWHSGKPCEGLSPLARGKHQRARQPGAARGPIPAGAGETPSSSSTKRVSRAYPRWRGGNRISGLWAMSGEGLSPLARGKLRGPGGGRRGWGPIPAGAGETVESDLLSPISGAYPRWRGGNSRSCRAWPAPPGLSPLARGKLTPFAVDVLEPGPIPAGAGETSSRWRRRRRRRAYPRWRGGNREKRGRRRGDSGLSPLARGKPAFAD